MVANFSNTHGPSGLGQVAQAPTQRHVQAVSQEGSKDMGFDPPFE